MRTLADQRLCEGHCGTLHSESEMSYGPDPYADEAGYGNDLHNEERIYQLAGELSTIEPLSSMHPENALPLARFINTRFNKPNLGLATTRELLNELSARVEIDYYAGGGGLDYSTVTGRPSDWKDEG